MKRSPQAPGKRFAVVVALMLASSGHFIAEPSRTTVSAVSPDARAADSQRAVTPQLPEKLSGASPVDGLEVVPGEVLVKFRRGTSRSRGASIHTDVGGQSVRRFSTPVGLELAKLVAGMDVLDAVERYRQHPDVIYAEPNYVLHTMVIPNDPLFGTLWGLHNTGQNGGTADADIDAPEAWDITTGSSAVVVAVIDSGIDYTHPDLAANMFRNTADCNANLVDDDGNGHVDDCYGIDTASDDSDPMDDNNHGTHVAGTIGAVGDNGIGVAGVNWNVRLMGCKFLNAAGSGATSDAIGCLDYVAMMKARGVNIVATNNSWGGGGFSQALSDAIDVQRQQGILFIAAAGNASIDHDVTPSYPADIARSNIIAVAATTRTETLSGFSDFGRRTVHLGAPGSEILSTTPGNTYSTFNGTSMATPHVTGVAALLKAQDPARDWRAIKNLILTGADSRASMSSTTITGRRLNAHGALTCTNSTVVSRVRPIRNQIVVASGVAVDLAALHIQCANPNGDVTVTANPGAVAVTLLDDGLVTDQIAGDGTYSGRWTPPGLGAFTLTFPGGDVVTVSVLTSYDVAPGTFDYRVIAGTNLNLGDDEAARITSPFAVPFGGGSFTSLDVGSNGNVSFSAPLLAAANFSMPTTLVSTLVAPMWDDLYPTPGTNQNVFWGVLGTTPNRELVIEWRDVRHFNCLAEPTTVKFQVVFFEGRSDIVFNYADTEFGGSCTSADRGGSATVGVQVSTTAGRQYSFNTASLTNNTALRWTLSGQSPGTPSIGAAPGTVNAGEVVTVTVADGPGNRLDWVAVRLLNGATVDWWYLNGTRQPPPTGRTDATFPVSMPNTAGTYEFRLFEHDGTGLLATSGPVLVNAVPALTINDASVTEGPSGITTATFTVTLTPASAQTVTVAYATANGTATGSDFAATNGTLTFDPNVTTRPITVNVNGDTAVEPTETFVVNLSGATNAAVGDAQGVGTIVNDDPSGAASISAAPGTAPPGGSVTVTVANGPGNRFDWVAVRPVNGTNVNWWYLNGTMQAPATGLSNTSFAVSMPQAAGNYEFRLFENDGANLLALPSAPVTVAVLPALTINDVSMTEGQSGTTTATFTVTLTPASAQTVTVAYATANGTATAGTDYTATNSTLTFDPNVTTRPITVTISGDTTVEPTETFMVNLSGATNAVVGDAQGLGTIVTDDAPPAPSISGAPGSVPPGGSVTVTVTNGPGNRLDWVAVRPVNGTNVDWWYLNGTRQPPATGLANASFAVTMPQAAGNYEFRLFENDGSTLLAPPSAPVTVAALPALTINDVSVTEGQSGTTTATFTVTLTPASAQTVTVAYATANGTATGGTDYTATNGTLTFDPNVTTRPIAVTISGDAAVEPTETFMVNLSGPTNAVVSDAQGVGTIVTDDGPPTPSISAAPGSVPPGGSVTVTVANGPGNRLDWIAVRPVNGTNVDWWYLNGTRQPPATGLANASFAVSMPQAAGNYEFRLFENDGSTLLAPPSAPVTVAALPALTINDVSVTEGQSGTTTATFTVTLTPASAQTVTVAYATANGTATGGTDYTATNGTLTFDPNVTTRPIAVTISGDTAVEPTETFLVNLSGPTNAVVGDAQGLGTIVTDDAPPPPSIGASPGTVNPGGSVTVSVANGPGNRLDWIAVRPVNGTNVDWWYLNGMKQPPASGLMNASIPVPMPMTAGNYEFRLFENDGGNVLAGPSGPVTVIALPSLTINDVSVTEGQSGTTTATFTVTLTPASAQTVTVMYATANGTAVAPGDFTTANATLTFDPGMTTQPVVVTVNGDTAVEPNETFMVNLSGPTNASLGDTQGIGTIANDDGPPTPAISASPGSVLSGGLATVTVANGPGNPLDWVAVRLVNGTDVNWWYLNGTKQPPATGLMNVNFQVFMPQPAGNYEFRFLENDGPVLLAPPSGPVTVTACADTDGDRLCNVYETNTGVYVNQIDTGTNPNVADTDGDFMRDGDEVLGTLSGLNLPAMGASPLKKNILLEYDWFDDNSEPGQCVAHSHRPTQAMVDRVSASFAASPVTNPDGTTGVTVIHDFGQGGVFSGGTMVSHAANITGGVNNADYSSVKAGNFAANRSGYFHYVVMAHHYSASIGSSGQAELPGDDLIVSLGCFNSTNNVSNTIMHELGHNLNLQHGGNEACNWKPNYNSVMNYRFQFPGVDTSCNAVGNSGETNVLDYSRGARLSLNENSLNESLGVCTTPTVAIDWNFSGTITSGLVYDLNRTDDAPNASTPVSNTGCSATLQTLNDFNDWANFTFTGVGDADGDTLFSFWLKAFQQISTCDNPVPPASAPALLKPQ